MGGRWGEEITGRIKRQREAELMVDAQTGRGLVNGWVEKQLIEIDGRWLTDRSIDGFSICPRPSFSPGT